MKETFLKTIAVCLAVGSLTAGTYTMSKGAFSVFEDATKAVVAKIDAASARTEPELNSESLLQGLKKFGISNRK